jgi:CHAT domain-containing protein
VRGEGKIKALLIGDPLGDLPEAKQEVLELRAKLCQHDAFEVDDDDVRIGPDRCQALSLLSALSSERYGLVHYSGHTKFDGYQSAWYLRDGKITTDLLTSALQNAPPVLVFSSSCESAAAAEMAPATYENQTFDLPSAFLQAGVEAYVGTLWNVEATAARNFVEVFYNEFLSGQHSLGECLGRAKSNIKGANTRTDWLAFILYGDPHVQPGELFPALRQQEEERDPESVSSGQPTDPQSTGS